MAHACFAHTGASEYYHSVYAAHVDERDKRTDEHRWEYQERRYRVETEGKVTRGISAIDRRVHGRNTSKRHGMSRAEMEADAERAGQLDSDDVTLPTGVPGLVSVVTASPLGRK